MVFKAIFIKYKTWMAQRDIVHISNFSVYTQNSSFTHDKASSFLRDEDVWMFSLQTMNWHAHLKNCLIENHEKHWLVFFKAIWTVCDKLNL